MFKSCVVPFVGMILRVLVADVQVHLCLTRNQPEDPAIKKQPLRTLARQSERLYYAVTKLIFNDLQSFLGVYYASTI